VTPEPGAAPDPGATTPDPGVPPEAVAPPVPGWRGRLRALRRPRVYGPVAGVAAVIVALAVAGATVGAGHAAPQSLGRAKNFTLGVLGHPGQHLSLQSMADRPVIVNFFASWCGPCKKETPLIARFYRDNGGRPAIIGVDVNDSAPAAMRFVHNSGVTYPVVADPAPMTAAIAYNLPGLPATFFLNSRHVIVKRVYGAVTQAELTTGARLMAGRAG
jgi:cytochrome c biogenesis protein CcmG, thiol:disulfide interchange protein DsbE